MPDDDTELRAQLEALHAQSFAWAVTCWRAQSGRG